MCIISLLCDSDVGFCCHYSFVPPSQQTFLFQHFLCTCTTRDTKIIKKVSQFKDLTTWQLKVLRNIKLYTEKVQVQRQALGIAGASRSCAQCSLQGRLGKQGAEWAVRESFPEEVADGLRV